MCSVPQTAKAVEVKRPLTCAVRQCTMVLCVLCSASALEVASQTMPLCIAWHIAIAIDSCVARSAVLAEIKAHCKDPSKPYPKEDNPLLMELATYLEWSGIYKPLAKVRNKAPSSPICTAVSLCSPEDCWSFCWYATLSHFSNCVMRESAL